MISFVHGIMVNIMGEPLLHHGMWLIEQKGIIYFITNFLQCPSYQKLISLSTFVFSDVIFKSLLLHLTAIMSSELKF